MTASLAPDQAPGQTAERCVAGAAAAGSMAVVQLPAKRMRGCRGSATNIARPAKLKGGSLRPTGNRGASNDVPPATGLDRKVSYDRSGDSGCHDCAARPGIGAGRRNPGRPARGTRTHVLPGQPRRAGPALGTGRRPRPCISPGWSSPTPCPRVSTAAGCGPCSSTSPQRSRSGRATDAPGCCSRSCCRRCDWVSYLTDTRHRLPSLLCRPTGDRGRREGTPPGARMAESGDRRDRGGLVAMGGVDGRPEPEQRPRSVNRLGVDRLMPAVRAETTTRGTVLSEMGQNLATNCLRLSLGPRESSNCQLCARHWFGGALLIRCLRPSGAAVWTTMSTPDPVILVVEDEISSGRRLSRSRRTRASRRLRPPRPMRLWPFSRRVRTCGWCSPTSSYRGRWMASNWRRRFATAGRPSS
jgi:hypothetical protein